MVGLSVDLLAALNERARDGHDATAIQCAIDELDAALLVTDPSSNLYGTGVKYLRRWCRSSGHLPSSCVLSTTILLESPHAVSSSALSDIYRGKCAGTMVAVKTLRLHVDNQEAVKKSFRSEVVTWKCLRHPNIVPFLGISDLFPVCMVSEWMPEGTISAFFEEHPGEHRHKFIREIIQGLEFMHFLGVIHGDLKAANILVDDNYRARLADFGVATVLYNSPTAATTTYGGGVAGTVRWMSPELHELPEEGVAGPKPSVLSDIYSLAMTIWELFTGQTPFPHIRSDLCVLLKVLGGERPTKPILCGDVGFDDHMWEVMQHAWAPAPERRPPLSEILQLVTTEPVANKYLPPNPDEEPTDIWYDCEEVDLPTGETPEALQPNDYAAGISQDKPELHMPVLAFKPRRRRVIPKSSRRPDPHSISRRSRRLHWMPKGHAVAVKAAQAPVLSNPPLDVTTSYRPISPLTSQPSLSPVIGGSPQRDPPPGSSSELGQFNKSRLSDVSLEQGRKNTFADSLRGSPVERCLRFGSEAARYFADDTHVSTENAPPSERISPRAGQEVSSPQDLDPEGDEVRVILVRLKDTPHDPFRSLVEVPEHIPASRLLDSQEVMTHATYPDEYRQIYYGLLHERTTPPTVTAAHEYDDAYGHYLHEVHDHLEYRYEILGTLSEGNYGRVLRCRDHKTGDLSAVKVVRNRQRDRDQALVEVGILEALRNPNPGVERPLLEIQRHFTFRGHVCIATEALSLSLLDLMLANADGPGGTGGLSLRLIRRFAEQLLLALAVLRRQGIIHHEVKPENVLLVHPTRSAIKLANFGSSGFAVGKGAATVTLQSRWYRAPEIIVGNTYSMSVDMWSLGCLLGELYTGFPLFPGEDDQEQLACMMEVLGVPEVGFIAGSSRKEKFFDAGNVPLPSILVNTKGRRRRPNAGSLTELLQTDDPDYLDFVLRCLRWNPQRRMTPDLGHQHSFLAGGTSSPLQLEQRGPPKAVDHPPSRRRKLKSALARFLKR